MPTGPGFRSSRRVASPLTQTNTCESAWAGCFNHVRRKFTDTKKGEAKPGKKVQSAKVSKADVALDKIRKLYAIEAEIEKLSSIEKLTIRQQNIKPLLNNLHEWLEKNVTHLVPGSLIHKAMSYALNQVAKTGHIL